MPRKIRVPASAAQNRENQRRSRERHRQFVEDLQQRIQEYERRGVEASVEMQRVARAVAWENKHLRGLLNLKGVSQNEVDHHLALAGSVGSIPDLGSWESLKSGSDSSPHEQSVREQLDSGPLGTTPDFPSSTSTPSSNPSSFSPLRLLATSASARSPSFKDASSSATEEALDCSATNAHGHENRDPSHTHTTQNAECATIPPISDDSWSELGDQTEILPQVTECFCPPNSPASISGHWDKGLSCQAAVEIISGLRSSLDSDRIRHLLRCKEGNDCLVYNSSVFQIIDTFA